MKMISIAELKIFDSVHPVITPRLNDRHHCTPHHRVFISSFSPPELSVLMVGERSEVFKNIIKLVKNGSSKDMIEYLTTAGHLVSMETSLNLLWNSTTLSRKSVFTEMLATVYLFLMTSKHSDVCGRFCRPYFRNFPIMYSQIVSRSSVQHKYKAISKF